MLLNRDQILTAKDLPFKDVSVPEWGGDVRVSTMTAADRDAFESSIYETTAGKIVLKNDNYRAKLLARCLTDDQGVRLFTEKDIEALGKKSARALQRLFNAAQTLNGLSLEEQEKIEKN